MDNIVTITFNGSAPIGIKLDEVKTQELLDYINDSRVARQNTFLSLDKFVGGMAVYIEPESINYIIVQTEEQIKKQAPTILTPQRIRSN